MFDIPKHIFRAYDIRGIVDKELNKDNLELIAKAIATMALEKNIKNVSLGRDGRLSSEEFSKIVIDQLLSFGINIIDVGMITTPMLYFSAITKTKGSGLMITGSHNPANYNGLKIMLSGETLSGNKIHKLFDIIQGNKFSEVSLDEGSYSKLDIFPAYLGYINNNITLGGELKIVIDTGNGVAGNYAGKLFRFLGCNVKELFSDVDGSFPNHNPDPSNIENLQFLIDEIDKGGFDLGIAFDGDGDRLVVVNGDGNIILPDRLLMLFARNILLKNKVNKIKKDNIIYDIKSTGLLYDWIKKHGGNPIISKTGHSFIKSNIKKYNAILAGEMSGHIFFNDKWFGFDDGLYAASRLLEILSKSQNPIKVLNEIPASICTPEINISLDNEEEKYNIIQIIKEKAKFTSAKNIITIDGLRVEYNKGFGLIRASNTTPSLVLRFEATDKDNLNKIKQDFKDALKLVNINLLV